MISKLHLKISMSLHSNLVLFKSHRRHHLSLKSLLYIPIWFYSNVSYNNDCDGCGILYIPIWFYSNIYKHECSRYILIFTFQSGSIQIARGVIFVLIFKNFTFQSGSIQMTSKYKTVSAVKELYIPIWFYSNVLPM